MSRLIEQWTKELGRDAAEAAFTIAPEQRSKSPAEQEQTLDRIEQVMRAQGWPPTVEYGIRAYQWLQSSDAVDLAAGEQPKPAAFKPKSEDVEADFYNNPNVSAAEIGRYLQQKHGHR